MAEQQPSGPKRRWVWWVFACLAVLVCLSPIDSQAAQGRHADKLFPMPKSLKPNVDFWIHVFARLEGGSGVLHDDEDMGIIYQTLYDLPRDKERRRSLIRRKRDYYKGILERLARGKRRGLTRDERRVLAMFEGRQTAAAFRKAAEQVRFQGGIREAFKAGLVRSGAYLPIIEPIFKRAGLPKELVLLPHVESSFRNDARSKSGAAGIWQFMPSTGRRFLRVNSRVDERHDVRLATIAATKLLKENYSLLGTWPLAITAYNHGAWGMKKAVAKTGTKDIGKIVRRYRGRTFGFASRNFYAEFLAAVHVVRNYERYFGSIRFAEPSIKPVRPQHYRVQRGDSLRRIAKRFNTTVSALAALNNLERLHLIQVGQILRIPVKHDRYRVRRGDTLGRIAKRFGTTVDRLVAMNNMDQAHFIKPDQVLRVPAGRMAAAPAVDEPVQPQKPRHYRVRRGDTLGRIAKRFGTTVDRLVAMNNMDQAHFIKPDQVLRVPAGRMAAAPAVDEPVQPQEPRHYRVRRGDTLGRIAKRFGTTVDTLVAMNNMDQAHFIKPGQVLRVPAGRMAASPVVDEPVQPQKPRHYRVRRGDTLGRIAKRFGTTVDTLVAMNGMDQAHFIKPGQVLRVAGGRTAASPVVHEPVQPQRPQRYRVRPGDSLSVIAARFNTTVATLAMVNGLSKSYLIKPGQVLDVAQPMPLRRYQVRRGDTLGRVAKRFRTTVAMLAALNGLRKPYLIRAGQTLVIPQLRSQHPDDSTVTGMRFPGEDLRVGLWVAAA